MKLFSHISRYFAFAVLLHLLLALAPAMAQNVHVGETSTFKVEPYPGDNYMWTLYNDSTVNFAIDPGTTSATYFEFVGDTNSPTVTILWKEPGIYFFKVNATDITGCTNNLKIGKVKVLPAMAKILEPTPICSGETCTLTIELTGYANSQWEYTVEFAPESGGTASSTIVGTATAGAGESRITTDLQVVPNPTVTSVFRVISITNTPNAGVGYTSKIPSKPVTLIVYPPPVTSDIYKKY